MIITENTFFDSKKADREKEKFVELEKRILEKVSKLVKKRENITENNTSKNKEK